MPKLWLVCSCRKIVKLTESVEHWQDGIKYDLYAQKCECGLAHSVLSRSDNEAFAHMILVVNEIARRAV